MVFQIYLRSVGFLLEPLCLAVCPFPEKNAFVRYFVYVIVNIFFFFEVGTHNSRNAIDGMSHQTMF